MDERRKESREVIDEVAYVTGDGSSMRCRVFSLSAGGAAIDVPNASFVPQQFKLMMERDRVVRSCRIAWIHGNRIGLNFLE